MEFNREVLSESAIEADISRSSARNFFLLQTQLTLTHILPLNICIVLFLTKQGRSGFRPVYSSRAQNSLSDHIFLLEFDSSIKNSLT